MMHLAPRTWTWRSPRAAAALCVLGALLLTVLPAQRAHAADSLGNAGFEADPTGTTTPADWSTYSATGQNTASFSENGGYSGSRRLTHWSASAYKVETYQYLTGLAAGTYTLSARVRSSGGQSAAYIALRNCGGAEQRTDLPPTPNGEWIRIVTSVRVSGGNCTVSLNSDAHAGSGPTSTISPSRPAPRVWQSRAATSRRSRRTRRSAPPTAPPTARARTPCGSCAGRG